MFRLLLVDDHPVVREGLAALLGRQTDLQVVAEASNGRQAIDLFRQHQPDLVLMDLQMPELGGVEAIKTIRAEFPTARFIVLTTFDGDEDIFRALQAGAQGYLLKDAPREELLAAIRTVASGGKHIAPEVAAKLADRLLLPELTERELAVLKLIVTGRSNKEIGSALTDRTQAATEALRRGIVHL
jgi:DNA-binding NarL/FixJ family response regulator